MLGIRPGPAGNPGSRRSLGYRPAMALAQRLRSAVSLPVAALGFRPFFLLAGVFGSLWVPLWLLVLGGRVQLPVRHGGMAWHGHEMIFGFTVAVIAGFLLTAVRNWTNKPTPTGGGLLALAALWTLGRLALLAGTLLPEVLAASIDLAFLPVLAVALGIPLWRSKNWRNIAFVPLLLALSALNATFHFGDAGMASRALRLAVDVVLLIIVLVGGRVIPMFTRNTLKGATLRTSPVLDWLAFGSTVLVLISDLVPSAVQAGAWAAFAAAGFNALRIGGWASVQTVRRPLLWVLHLGYAWLPIGFFLKGLAVYVPSIPPNAALHALTVGAIGLLTLGMMSRVALGHTGRPLEVGRPVAGAFVLVALAAVGRSILPIFAPDQYMGILWVSGLCWAVGFLVFSVSYWQILTQPRVDGRAG